MARRGLATALQAALAGFGGYGQGVIAQRERERKQALEKKTLERQDLMDMLTLSREPLVTPGPLATRAPVPTTPPKLAAGAPPSSIPLPGRADFGTAMQALEREEAQPSGTVPFRIGDQTFNVATGQRRADILRSQDIQKAQELAQTQADMQRQLDETKNLGYFNVYKKKYDKNAQFDPTTPYKELIDIEESALQRASSERSAAARATAGATPPTIGAGLDYTRDLQTISQFVPSEKEVNGKRVTVAPQRKLNSLKLAMVRDAGGNNIVLGSMLAAQNMLGQDFSNEMAYYTTAAGIAQAYAIQEQRGRNVSDLDIKNRVRQITVQPEEVGNPEVELLKAARLRQWTAALQNPSTIPQINAGETATLPRLGVPQAQRQGGSIVTGRTTFTGGLPFDARDF